METGVHPEAQARLPIRSIIRGTLEGLAGLGFAGAAVLAVLLKAEIGHRWVDIFAQFAAPMFIVLAVATGLTALIRMRKAAWTGCLASLLMFVCAAPQWFPADPTPEPEAPVVRLYSANVYYLNDDVAAMRRSIEAADPDLIILIELGRAPLADLDRLLEGYPYRAGSMRMDETRGPSRSIIASRWPLRQVANRPDGLHSVTAVAETPLGALNLIGVHLTRPWPFQYQWGQISQTMALGDIRRTLDGPVIIAGDFNSVSNARIGRQMKQDLGMSPAGGFPGTWPSSLPSPVGITIDQVWRSPDLTFTSRRLGRPNGSDHRPVVTEFTRAKP
ncbi:endonuclease/exonuclease/phosphatase family protein [Brevundimonas sp. FT23028]|uniref:endonuclease/exonuclease/phosphatase family protein n=1 Tax=Brevundimonas sp. FT23028 TaxID=3393748 RepID=UPI003B587469